MLSERFDVLVAVLYKVSWKRAGAAPTSSCALLDRNQNMPIDCFPSRESAV